MNEDNRIEKIILDMLNYYYNKETFYDCEEYRKQGAIDVLEGLLEILSKE